MYIRGYRRIYVVEIVSSKNNGLSFLTTDYIVLLRFKDYNYNYHLR